MMREGRYIQLLSNSNVAPKEVAKNVRSQRRVAVDSDISRFARLLTQAGIPFSPRVYILFCVCIGTLLFLGSLNVGPIFATAFSIALSYELLFSYPLDKAARTERMVAADLPLCAELLGERIASGTPFSTALVETVSGLPPGLLRSEVEIVVKNIQKGISPTSAISALSSTFSGPEMRAFCAAVKMYCLGGVQHGEPLVRLAAFIRDHRLVTDAVERRVQTVRQTFAIIFSGLSIGSLFLIHFLPNETIYSQAEVPSLARELGALLIISALVLAMRITAKRNWEIDDGA